MLPDKLVFVDLETTGARSAYDRILEIGIIRVENNVITDTFQTLFNPLTHIPPEIERLTGISMQDIVDAPVFSSQAKKIRDLLKDCVFVAHNVRFDYGFLKHELKREGIDFTAKHFCTVKLSQYLFPQHRHHNLDSIIERFSFPKENRHRALSDAAAIHLFYETIRKTLPETIVLEAVNKALRKPSLPLHLQKEDVEKVPESPGVYIFYGDADTPLYIGKSKNLKDRVLAHFSADIHHGIEMKISQQVKRIESLPTAGELGALLLESKLVKERLPLYNRQLRLKQQLTALVLQQDLEGYNTVHTETFSSITPSDLEVFSAENPTTAKKGIIGFFRSSKQAKQYLSDIAKEAFLCEKLLGLEKTLSSCFGYRLERCKGACIGKEKPLFYNLRFLKAIHSVRIKPWPFLGPIVIEEKNELTDKIECFIADKWCFLGSFMENDTDLLSDTKKDLEFDLDVYKILRRYLSNPANHRNIRDIPPQLANKFYSSSFCK